MSDLTSETVKLSITARPPVGVDVLREAAGRWAEGTLIRWCPEHDAQDAGSKDEPLGYCWHAYYLNQAATIGVPCRIVERRLCE